MAVLRSFSLGAAGLAGGLLLFDRAAAALAGTSWTWTAHLGLGAVALAALVLARSVPWLRPALIGLALVLVAVTLGSALVVPGLIRAEALRLADGRPLCLAGPEVSAEPDGPRRDPFVLLPSPAQTASLTLLTLPRPLTLVIALPPPVPDDVPGGKPDAVFATHVWSGFASEFKEVENFHLREPGDSTLLDCVPLAEPFAPEVTANPMALVVWRSALPDQDGASAWGPRQQATLRLPAGADPVHGGRFRDAMVRVTLSVLPGDGPPPTAMAPVALAWVPDPATWLDKRRRARVRDRDAGLDWADLPAGPLGLVAYEVPSTSVADGIEGTYVLPGADGLPLTVIACDPFRCRHHSRLGPALPVVVSTEYPVTHLPRWRDIEDAVRAESRGVLRVSG